MTSDASTIATVALAVIALLGIMAGGVAWFYRRGGQERELILAMRETSSATRSLSSRMDEFMEHYRTEHNALDKRVDNHDLRLSVNEAAVHGVQQEVSAIQNRLWQKPQGATQ